MIIDRFAPSPTGLLHLGHAYSALLGWQQTRRDKGRFLLRLEDLDSSRVRPEFEQAIYQDLAWLGVEWERPVLRQSDRHGAYVSALQALHARGLTYRCTCTRRDIAAAIAAPQNGDAPTVYPGTCRLTGHGKAEPYAIRLNVDAAIRALGGADAVRALTFAEIGSAEPGLHPLDAKALRHQIGDIVLSRRDGAIAYHLAVVVDDAYQGVTRITRGLDLFEATWVHRLLQALLGLPTPEYHHHRLILDDTGKRLAKRDDARAIRTYRQDGLSPADIRRMVGLTPPD